MDSVIKFLATSTNLLELELLSEPATSTNGFAATCLTATCLFSVA